MQHVRVGTFALAVAALFGTARAATPFDGAWIPNVKESTFPPGGPPKGVVTAIHDDGKTLHMVQSFIGGDGQRVRFIWSSKCDGTAVPVGGIGTKLGMKASCERISDRAIHYVFTSASGPRHDEICTVSADGRKSVYKGADTMPDGSRQEFVYVDDRMDHPDDLAIGATGAAIPAMPFEGVWVPNIAESTFPTGYSPPPDAVTVVHDDGRTMRSVQVWTDQDGKPRHYIGVALCDGKLVPMRDSVPELGMKMSCLKKSDRIMLHTLTGKSGYRQEETCTVSPDGRKNICKGADMMPGTKPVEWMYVDERIDHPADFEQVSGAGRSRIPE